MKARILEAVQGLVLPIMISTFFNGIIVCYINTMLGLVNCIIVSLCMYRCVTLGYLKGQESFKLKLK